MAAFYLGLSIAGFFVYRAYSMTPSEYSAPHDGEKDIPMIRGYDDVANDNMSTLNIKSNADYQTVEKIETGPFGVPRRLYVGPGGVTIPVFGNNYNKL